MPESESNGDAEFGLVCPFWIDTDAYTDRDRQMFVCGYEFATIMHHARNSPEPFRSTIHRENESRLRMMCARFGWSCEIEACEAEHDPDGTWSYFEMTPRGEEPSNA